jgi:hypothetical protein
LGYFLKKTKGNFLFLPKEENNVRGTSFIYSIIVPSGDIKAANPKGTTEKKEGFDSFFVKNIANFF